jgi:aryl-alcohol dehydrogenase-like predicted oxidoreductase
MASHQNTTPTEAAVVRWLKSQERPADVYLREARAALEAAVEQVLIDRPDNPLVAIGQHLCDYQKQAEFAQRSSSISSRVPTHELEAELAPVQRSSSSSAAQVATSKTPIAGSSTAQIDTLFEHSPQVAALAVDAANALAVGDAEASVELFDAILAIDASLSPLLWQRGLALFYQGSYAAGAAQFLNDVTANGNDVEEVVWHHLCLCQLRAPEFPAHAAAHMRAPSLLACGFDDRPVMHLVQQLYESGATNPAEGARRVLPSLMTDHGSYGRFYAALWLEVVCRDHAAALPLFAAAAEAPTEDFMGRVMRMHARRAQQQAAESASIPRVPIGSTYRCPRLIVGGWQLSSGHSKHPEGSDLDALHKRCHEHLAAHVAAGLVAFDLGDTYTGVEVIVGRFVGEHVARGRRRASLLLHTKLVPDLDELGTFGMAETRRAVERSCGRLQTSYLDLVQFHWWDLSVRRYVEVAQHLATLRRQGLVRELGLTNFALEPTREIVQAGVPIATTQVQLSLLDRRVETSGLGAYCVATGIQILPYGALAGGLLSDRWLGQPQPPADPLQHESRSLTKYLLIVDEAGGWGALQALLRALRAIADDATAAVGGEPMAIADVALAWVRSRPGVGGVIVGARGIGRIQQMVRAASRTLPAELLARATAAAELHLRPVPGTVYELERVRDGPHGRIMRYNLQQLRGASALVELEDRTRAALEVLEQQRRVAAEAGDADAPKGRTLAARRFVHEVAALRREAAALVAASEAPGAGTAEDIEVAAKAKALITALEQARDQAMPEAEAAAAYDSVL